jgi:hypothetical protein
MAIVKHALYREQELHFKAERKTGAEVSIGRTINLEFIVPA